MTRRLWLDVAVRGLKRYLDDAGQGRIPRRGLVLDVGAGDRPHIRADIVCDKYQSSWERGMPLLHDRPLVFGDIDALPFKDDAFDYVICQHLVEHLEHPERALAELSRVGRAGLIRTPSPLAEKLISRDVHRWYVSVDGPALVLRQKPRVFFDREITESLWGDRRFWHFFGSRIRDMETSYRWVGAIQFRVERCAPGEAEWDGRPAFVTGNHDDDDGGPSLRDRLRRAGSSHLGRLYRRGVIRRPRSFDLAPLLRCPACHGDIELSGSEASCPGCEARYPVQDGVPIMFAPSAETAEEPGSRATTAA
jgi:uncharacterized protein YbaR (Trm112 family)